MARYWCLQYTQLCTVYMLTSSRHFPPLPSSLLFLLFSSSINAVPLFLHSHSVSLPSSSFLLPPSSSLLLPLPSSLLPPPSSLLPPPPPSSLLPPPSSLLPPSSFLIQVQQKVMLKYDSWHREILSRFGTLLGDNMRDFHTTVAKVNAYNPLFALCMAFVSSSSFLPPHRCSVSAFFF